MDDHTGRLFQIREHLRLGGLGRIWKTCITTRHGLRVVIKSNNE